MLLHGLFRQKAPRGFGIAIECRELQVRGIDQIPGGGHEFRQVLGIFHRELQRHPGAALEQAISFHDAFLGSRGNADLVRAFEAITAYPEGGRDRSLFAPGLRSLTYKRHVNFFARMAVADDEPVILRIVHERRNMPALVYSQDLRS